jgi:hypothetical protein
MSEQIMALLACHLRRVMNALLDHLDGLGGDQLP